MKSIFKYLALSAFSIVIAEVMTLGFFFLRYLADSLNIPANWYLIVPYLVSLLTACLIFLIAKKFNLSKAKEFAIIIFILWLLWLVFLGKLLIH